jgi:predicted acylesterase/phospholipase RssA
MEPPSLKTKPIQHLVFSGGNIYGYTFYGIMKTLQQNGVWNLANIRTIYATSIGAVISTIIALNYDWETTDKYLIHRPMNELINFDISTILGCVQNCGFFTPRLIENYFYNLFTGKDMSPKITMLEFFEKTGIELHFFTTKITGFEMIDLSYKTHPDWMMTEAIYASSALFPFLSPLFKDGELYVDGGFLLNNPLTKCIESITTTETADVEDKLDSILVIRLKKYVVPNQTRYLTVENYNIFNFFEEFVENILKRLDIGNLDDNERVTNITIDSSFMNTMDFTIYSKMECRKELIDYGIQIAEIFLRDKLNA